MEWDWDNVGHGGTSLVVQCLRLHTSNAEAQV